MENELLTYNEVLQRINNEESSLLLGNGFNNSLGINTGYKNIFEKMIEEDDIYKHIKGFLDNNFYDIEILIDQLKKHIEKNESDKTKSFLYQFIEKKIKLDFMKATYSIIHKELKNIYQEKNKGIYLLFKNFTNYFSLNYDPFLYLLLMKFKIKTKETTAVAFSNTTLFKENNFDENKEIYTEIKKAREFGLIQTYINSATDYTTKFLCDLSKKDFEKVMVYHFTTKGFKKKEIKKVCAYIWEKEQNECNKLNINDGFLFNEYKYDEIKQNIFFIHGAFHIYQKNKQIYKITQEEDSALYNRLEEIINSENKEVLCILTNTSEEKEKNINSNIYTKNCFNKLGHISGNLVIFGSSLAPNDEHIFKQIDASKISTLYISTSHNMFAKNRERAKKLFHNKKIYFFDYQTISYNAKL